MKQAVIVREYRPDDVMALVRKNVDLTNYKIEKILKKEKGF